MLKININFTLLKKKYTSRLATEENTCKQHMKKALSCFLVISWEGAGVLMQFIYSKMQPKLKVDLEDQTSKLQAIQDITQNNLSFKDILSKYYEDANFENQSSEDKTAVLNAVREFIQKVAPQNSETQLKQEIQDLKTHIARTQPQLQNEIQAERLKYESVKSELEKERCQKIYSTYKTKVALEEEAYSYFLSALPKYQLSCTKIQAAWRGYQQRQNYYKLLFDFANSKNNPDSNLLKTLAEALKNRNLSLECCFRAADTDLDGVVSCTELMKFLSQLKLGLSQIQMLKVMEILDEDCSGKIDSREFYKSLEAYGVATEKHRDNDKTYQQEVLLKLSGILEHREISPDEVFNLCDLEGTGYISIEDFNKRLLGLKLGFKEKELYSLSKLLDANQDGAVSKEEFKKHLSRGKQMFTLEKLTPTNKAPEPFKTDSNKVIKALVQKMESKGVSLAEAFEMIQSEITGKATLVSIARSMSQWFYHVSIDEILKLLSLIDLDQNGIIDPNEVYEFLSNFSSSEKQTTTSILFKLAKQLDSTNLPECFGHYDIKGFINLMLDFGLSETQAIQLFNSIDTEKKGSVSFEHLTNVLSQLNNPNSNKELTTESLTDKVTQTLDMYGLVPANVFRLADKTSKGSVTIDEFQTAFARLVPKAEESFVTQLGDLFGSPTISYEDLIKVFGEPHQGAQTNLDSFGYSFEQVYWLSKTKLALEKLRVTPQELFLSADTNKDGSADTSELRSAMKRLFPGIVFTHAEITHILIALDKNRNGLVNQGEFIEVFGHLENSEFYEKSLKKINSEKQPKYSPKPLNFTKEPPNKAPCPALPFKNTASAHIQLIFQKLISVFHPKMAIHKYYRSLNVFPESIINFKRFCRLTTTLLTQFEAKEAFDSLDVWHKGSVYAYVLFSVLDSYRSDLLLFPYSQNPQVEPQTKDIFYSFLKQFRGTKPLYSYFEDLSQKVGWEDPFVLSITNDVRVLKLHLPPECYYYHLATAVQTYQTYLTVCPVQVLNCFIQQTKQSLLASEFFETFSLKSQDSLNKTSFINKVSRALEVSAVEADELHRAVYRYSEDHKPLYQFFTFFDRVLSTFDDGAKTFPLPKLPTNERTDLDPSVKHFYSKLAEELNQPVAKYKLGLSENLSCEELANSVADYTFFSKPELIAYFGLLKMNKNEQIKVYHLVAVLDSYREKTLNLEYIPLHAIVELRSKLPKDTYGSKWLCEMGYRDLECALEPEEVKTILPEQTGSTEIFKYLDNFERGFIYTHQLATLVDIALMSAGDLKEFPLCQNSSCPAELKKVLEDHATNLDNYSKSAANYYKSQNTQIDRILDKQEFLVEFSKEFTKAEATLLFQSLELKNSGFIRTYHYVSCLESFCRSSKKGEAYETLSLDMLPSLGLQVPSTQSTPDFFSEIYLESLVNVVDLLKLVMNKFCIDLESSELFLKLVDPRKKAEVFGYQVFSAVDLVRACIQNHRIEKELSKFPFRWENPSKDLKVPFQALGEKLDMQDKSTLEYFLELNFDPYSECSVQQFVRTSEDFSETQSADIFEALDLLTTGQIKFYHFLAVIESYRSKTIPSSQKLAKAFEKPFEKSQKETVSPLQSALIKLGDFFNGQNEYKAQLSASQVFGFMDKNKRGKMSLAEFELCLDKLELNFTEQQKYLLMREADLNKDGIIDYNEFSEFVRSFACKTTPKKEAQATGLKAFKARPVKEVKGLEHSLGAFTKGSVEEAIYKTKQYIRSNTDKFSSLQFIFQRFDERNQATVFVNEFRQVISKLKLSLSSHQVKELTKLADSNQDGQIKYFEFIDFLYDFDFSASPVGLNDSFFTLAPSDLTIAAEIQSYELTEEDYFNKYSTEVTTILNSELAAIKRCVELVQNKHKFLDPDFGPEQQNKGGYCLYLEGSPPSSKFPSPEELHWKSLSEVGSVKFYETNSDILQGCLQDCWMLGALGMVSSKGMFQEFLLHSDQINTQTASKVSKGIYPPVFHMLSSKGLYVFKFFKNSAWRWVIVDDRVPLWTRGKQHEFVFACCRNKNLAWVPLIEKAYAKLHGCYEALSSGLTEDALSDFTGGIYQKVQLTPDCWKTLTDYCNKNLVLGCIKQAEGPGTDVVVEGEVTGLLAQHAYTILDALYVPNSKADKARHRLLRIRNPWSRREWKGKWGDFSPKLQQNYSALKDFIEKMDQTRRFNPGEPHDGEFLMCYKDWREIFDYLYVSKDLSNWWGVCFEGKWLGNGVGGVPVASSEFENSRWAQNPQYILELTSDTDLVISLQQPDSRLSRTDKFPFQKSLYAICLSVMKLEPTQNKADGFDPLKIQKLSKLKTHREVTLEVSVGPGKYSIVPSTQFPHQFCAFWLSIYFSCAKSSVKLYSYENPSYFGKEILDEEVYSQTVTERHVKEIKQLVTYLASL